MYLVYSIISHYISLITIVYTIIVKKSTYISFYNMTNLRAKKSLGQNFLHNKSVLKLIIESSNISKDDNIIEIGPGTGNLTEFLLETKANVLSIEKDERMETVLKERFKDFKNFKLVFNDIRSFYPSLVKKQKKDFKIVANIPYYLTAFLFRLIFDNHPKPSVCVFMVQKEIGEKLALRNCENNKLRMFTSLFFDIKYIKTISKNNFNPVPKVDSAIIQLTLKKTKYSKKFIEKFTKIILASFKQPRKILISNLKNYYSFDVKYQEVFKTLNLNEKTRASELSFEKYLELIDNI